MVDIPTVPVSDADDSDFHTRRFGTLAHHHALWCDALDDVEAGLYNLMGFMPPGAAKSTYTDVVFGPRYLARQPRRQIILASYATDIVRKQGRRARQLVKSASFQELFPGVTLSTESSAMDEWALSNGSEFMAGGLLSGLTGNRAGLGIIDDPIRGRKDAESQTIRDSTWDAYQDDFCSRLKPGACQVMILTRWHEDDPAGRILPEGWSGESGMFEGRDGRAWRVICLPAIADRDDDPLGRKIGDTLWPEWFPASHWEPFRRNARTWASLYQQKPSPDEGTYFQRDWFGRWSNDDPETALPPNLHHYLTSDHAQTEDGDWTVMRVWGIAPDGDVFLIGGFRHRKTADETAERAIEMIRRYKPLCWFPENDATWRSIAPFITRMLREANLGCRIEPLPTSGDKISKSRGFQGLAAQGRVWLPDTQEGDEILDEYLRFPAGKHDDEVDAAALIGRAIDEAHPGIAPRESVPEIKKRYVAKKRRGSAWAA